MSWMTYGINEEPHITTYNNILNSLRDESLITREEYELIKVKVNDNMKWTDKYYPEILEYFNLEPITTLAPITTGF
jgi:hypothetical protein